MTRLLNRLILGFLVGMLAILVAPSTGSASIREYRISTNRSPTAITAGPDGAIWFTAGSKVGRLTTKGSVRTFTAGGGLLLSISAGPDGALWVTDLPDGRIGRFTTSGTFSDFYVPPTNSKTMHWPFGITSGPDGALWFANSFSTDNRIVRLTTAGIFSSFQIPTPASGAVAISKGPDGALWFAEHSANQIGRVTTGGVFSEFPIPTPASGPQAITTGPDGALWFTENDANKIGRVTTGGSFSEFPIPTSASKPVGITSGPDHALWFAESTGNKIGRVTTTGSFREFRIPTAKSAPIGITAGPDGAIWFTERDGNKIGRITAGGAPPPVLGKTANLTPVKGKVLVKPKGSTRFAPLSSFSQVPVGSTVDTLRGTVELATAKSSKGGIQSAFVHGGRFQVDQRKSGLTNLRLRGGNFQRCRATKAGRAAAVVARHRRKPPVRKIFVKSKKAHYRTTGNWSSTTERGTIWVTEDRCDGTLTRVIKGKVTVRDFVRKKTIIVKAGRSYLARRR